LLLDSYAWIEYFLGSAKGSRVETFLKEEQVVTPTIVLAEIARKYIKEGFSEGGVRKRLFFIASKSLLTEISIELAIEAGKAYMQLLKKAKKEDLDTPSLADAIILASARTQNLGIVTGDPHFKGLKEVEYIGD
jgi:predicted nucleic acid-binding protein